jgi:hypothetical protein
MIDQQGAPHSMKPPVVLMLTTYPIARPRHGGQVRARALVDAYRAAGWEVATLAVFEAEAYAPDSRAGNDVEFPPWSTYRQFEGRSVPFIVDYLSGIFGAADDGAYGEICGKIPKHIDVVHLEQPWLLPLAERIRNEQAGHRTKLVYGSQNVEHALKRKILEQGGIRDADDVLEHIEALEVRATQTADLVLAVTRADQAVLAAHRSRPVAYAPNGIGGWSVDPASASRWRALLPRAPWALFVGSAHPPNVQGFVECFGDSLACVPPDSRVVVAGSVCEHVYQAARDSRWAPINLSRLQLLGELSNEDLAAVKTLASVFLLPITQGGGSNIKTAEAIYSGKLVVGTSTSFRGYEDYVHLPEITIADDVPAFRRSVMRFLVEAQPAPVGSASDALRERLLWTHCLRTPIAGVRELVEG